MRQPGDYVGRYEIQALIGEGGFGQVYRAYDPKLERAVAIKELLGERRTAEPSRYAEHLARFQLEYRVQSQFKHPHIVAVYDLVEDGGNEYLIEELMEGGTLRDWIDRTGPLSPQVVVQIGSELCQAIAAMWARDIVHRDIKPNNILLTSDGHAKLSDFGVAQVGQISQRTHSDSHHPGTPAYMSPEQEKGSGYLDERSDLYSLGMVLYEALTGKSYKRERVLPRQLNASIPKALDTAIARLLDREPERRYQSASEAEAALRGAFNPPRSVWPWLIGLGVTAAMIGGGLMLFRPASPVLLTPTVTITPTIEPSPTTTVKPPLPTTTAINVVQPTLAATIRLLPSGTPTLTPTATRSPTPIATATAAAVAPVLISPPGGSTVNGSHLTLQWQGNLPSADFAYRVTVAYNGGDPVYVSPLLDVDQWSVELPASRVGAWSWSVEIVRRAGTSGNVARSAEAVFYNDPFGPFVSPLPTPKR